MVLTAGLSGVSLATVVIPLKWLRQVTRQTDTIVAHNRDVLRRLDADGR